jgi:hypothetical protein
MLAKRKRGGHMPSPQAYRIAADISTIVACVVFVVTLLVTWRRVTEATKSRHLEGMLRVLDILGSEEARSERRSLYLKYNRGKLDPATLQDEERRLSERVCIPFDRVGVLVDAHLVPEDDILKYHYDIILRSWSILEPLVKDYQCRLGRQYYGCFAELAQKAQKYCRQKGIPLPRPEDLTEQ